MANEMMKAMVAAAGLPDLDDVEDWARIGAWWRDKGTAEADLQERVAELENEAADHEELMEVAKCRADLCNKNADEWRDKYQRSERDLITVREDNAALRKVIDKFTMTVPFVTVGQALRNIEARCKQAIPERNNLSGDLNSDEQRWHPILRAVLNDARRALAVMEDK